MDLTPACGRLRRQTSARLKITFVDMIYPGQRPEPPSLSPHFLLVGPHVLSLDEKEQLICSQLFPYVLKKSKTSLQGVQI